MDLNAIGAAVSSIRIAVGITKSILDAKTQIDIQTQVIALQSALLEAQSCALEATTSQYQLQSRVRDLEAQASAALDFDGEKGRYLLACPWKGPAQVYALKKERSNGEPAHYLCANCFHTKRRVILNPSSEDSGWISMVCPVCNASMDTGYRGIGAPRYAEDITQNG